jgi:hypothetical protein
MQLSVYFGVPILLLLVSFATLTSLVSGVDAIVIPPAAWSNFQSAVLASSNGPIRIWQLLDAYTAPSDFWERAANLGGRAQQYTNDILHDAAASYATVADKIDGFKQSMTNVVSSTSELRREIQIAAWARGINLHRVSQMLSSELAIVFEELKVEFPPPDHAECHDDRVNIISRALVMVEDAVVCVGAAVGVSEVSTRAHFRDVSPHLQSALVIIGDVAEQHPLILDTLAFSAAILLMPEITFLKPIIKLFGIGPAGPIKGSPAAWAQSRLFGAAIPDGSWFSHLQSAAMKIRLPPNICKKICGVIGVILGSFGWLFGGSAGCRRR